MSDPIEPQGPSSGSGSFPFAPKGGPRRAGSTEATSRLPPGALPPQPAPPPASPSSSGLPPYMPPQYQPPAYQAPARPAPQDGGPAPMPRVLEETEESSSQKRQFWFLLIGFSIFLAALTGVGVYSLVRSYRKVEEGTGKMGVLAMALYGQSSQRMYLLTQSIDAYVSKNNVFPPSVAALKGYGDPAMTVDKWGRPFEMEGERLICLGVDGKLGTKDDMALNLATLQLESELPDISEVISGTQSLPPGARTTMVNMQKQLQKAVANQERLEMIRDERSFDDPGSSIPDAEAPPTVEESTMGSDSGNFEPSADEIPSAE